MLLGMQGYAFAFAGIGPDDPYEQTHDQSVLFNKHFLDTIPLTDRQGDFVTGSNGGTPFDLRDPEIIKQKVEYDPLTNRYIITEKIGEQNYRNPTYLTFDEYVKWRNEQQQQAYFDNLSGVRNDFMTFTNIEDPIEQFDIQNDLLNRLFGGNDIKVEPKGNIDITLGMRNQKVQNPNLPVRQQAPGPRVDFDMDINMGLNAKIGDKLDLNFDYNTNATFNFENKFKLKFDSETFSEDDIIKNIEAGDVSLPLNSTLIQGNQSLFGLKTELQFGRLYLTTVVSQQRSEQENITVQNGAQWQEYEIRADEYDENRHFLVSHFNRDQFNDALRELPQIHSLFRITRMEVWVTSINNEYEDLRQIVAVSDLGEYNQFTTPDLRREFALTNRPDSLLDKIGQNILPDNNSNKIYKTLTDGDLNTLSRQIRTVQTTLTGLGFQNGRDFEQRRARKLSPNRYTLIPELGVISLDAALRPDEVLAVAYEYTYNGKNYQVGEFASDVPAFSGADSSNQVIYVKMLKSSLQQVDAPMFDLMMKNFYSIGAYQASEEDFQFDIYYDDPGSGYKRFLPETDPKYATPLLSAYGLDQLNFYGDPAPDGFFDFIPGVTINTRTGKVMFPVLEPFGEDLQKELDLPNDIYSKYEYEDLYRKSVFNAQEAQEKNRFVLRGSYKSSVSNEISLGSFNLPPNSVTVRSGGVTLKENVDYVVDYQIGRVRIINDAYIASGAPINVSFEDRTLFGFNRQSMMGVRADYKLNKKMNLGGTFMKLWERPFTPKVNFGDDPINNNIYGLDFSYSDEAPWLTKAVDALPIISTKETSNIDFYAEGAWLKPGHSKAINVGDDEGGVVYIDDFEGANTGILLASQINRWNLASTPQGVEQIDWWGEGALNDSPITGANRALMNWYRLQLNIPIDQNDPYERFFRADDIFPGTNFENNFVDFRTMDVRYYPKTPGPYNFDVPGGYPGYTAGILSCAESESGKIELREPETRWAGIMREIDATNFEAANVQALEFWVLNPFINDELGENDGELVFHIGNISEDILKDNLAFYENSMPIQGDQMPVEVTNLGQVPSLPPVIFAFANDNAARELQDVGLDGYNDLEEVQAFDSYIEALRADGIPNTCIDESLIDPITGTIDVSRDNYAWFDDDYFDNNNADIAERFRRYNGTQGNSPIASNNSTFSNSFTAIPDAEDINEDGSSERTESYFEYVVKLNSNGGEIDLTDPETQRLVTDTVIVRSNTGPDMKWYRFKIPLEEKTNTIGSISDFRSIKFIRMITREFTDSLTLRFAKLEFTRNQWRKVQRPLSGFDGCSGVLDVNVVNVEEHSARTPFNYVLPPGIDREENFQSAFRGQLLNEQSLALEFCNAGTNCVQGVYKLLGMNMREYERLKMFIHAETEALDMKDGDISFMLRLGSDYSNNYYEYEIPLDFSELGASQNDQDVIWKIANRVDVELQALKNLKIARNSAGVSATEPFEMPYENGVIRVVGNPNLGEVKTFFMGLRNNSNITDFCADIWANELRLTGFNEKGGAAALGRLDMQLADFGNVALSGNISGIGFGALDQKILERSQEKIVGYDAATNLELGQFFGEKSNVKIPFFAQYSSDTRTPKYDPYDRDLTIKEKIASTDSQEEKDLIKENAQNQTIIKTVSVNNVRKEKKQGKKVSLPWDISNVTLSYTNTSTEHRDPILSKDDSKQQTLTVDYRYNLGSKPIEPFKKLIKTDKWIKFIKDINFNPLPSSFSMRNVLDRRQRIRQFRTVAFDPSVQLPEQATATSRQFLWNRDYRLSWDLTKSIKFNYFATNEAAVDELDNDGFTLRDSFIDPSRRDEYLWDNLKNYGRNKQFNQNFDISYKLPFSKFGILDWISTDVRYSANYTWNAASIRNLELGHSIQNGSDGSVRFNANFERLYNKSKFLASINKPKRKASSRKGSSSRSGSSSKSKKDGKSKTVEAPDWARVLLRPVMALRRARFNYTESHTSYVPGLNRTPKMLGLSSGFEAPGWEYIAGFAPDTSWLSANANAKDPESGYFVNHDCVNQEFTKTYAERWDAQVSIEPFRDFKLDISADKNYNESQSTLFKYQPSKGDYDFGTFSEFGSYTVSYAALSTLFDDNVQGLFETFTSNMQVMSKRVSDAAGNPNPSPHPTNPNYINGYGPTQQEVIIPAFISAYRGENPNSTNLNVFKQTPKPNWTLTYNGLTKIPWFKDRFQRFSLSHTYKATLTVNQFNTDLRFNSGFNVNPVSGDYYARLNIPQVVITEGMTPLIKLDIATVDDMTMSFEYGTRRTLSLDPDNQQINETKGTNWSIGFGYAFENVYLGFIPGAQKPKSRSRRRRGSNSRNSNPGNNNNNDNDFKGNTMKISCDVSLKDDLTSQHLWGLDVSERPTRGQRAFTLSPAIDYDVNEFLSLRLFYDYRSTKPYTNLSYPIKNTRAGLRLRFQLK